jgi:hypothetical protein
LSLAYLEKFSSQDMFALGFDQVREEWAAQDRKLPHFPREIGYGCRSAVQNPVQLMPVCRGLWPHGRRWMKQSAGPSWRMVEGPADRSGNRATITKNYRRCGGRCKRARIPVVGD